jgi:hypothetical protein
MRNKLTFLATLMLISGLGLASALADEPAALKPGSTLRGQALRNAITKRQLPATQGLVSAPAAPSIPSALEDLSFETPGVRNQFPGNGPVRGFDLAVLDIRQQVVKPGRLVIIAAIQNIGNTQFPGGQSAQFTSFDQHLDGRDRFDRDLTLGTIPLPIMAVGETKQVRVTASQWKQFVSVRILPGDANPQNDARTVQSLR